MYIERFVFLAVVLALTTADLSITFPSGWEPEKSEAPKPHVEEETLDSHGKEVANRVARLGLNTLRDLLSGHSNVVISPLNVYSCLGVLNSGAVGETKEEIHRVLGHTDGNRTVRDIVDSIAGVSYASAVFLDEGLAPRTVFADAIMNEYQASVLNVNVSDGERARETINSWVSDHTNGTIANLLQGRLEQETRMVVVSALLFKGKWQHSFPTAATVPGKFETGDNSSVEVPFMHLLATVPLVRNPHFDAISLPYVDSHGMTMHVILPKDHGALPLKNLLSHLNPNSLRKLRKESPSEEIFIILPKMSVDGRFSLKDTLKKRGIVSMFNPAKANFSAILEDSKGLFVSQIYHSIHFDMNEEGTVASAATAAILTKRSRFIFRANRPFIFIITDESDLILFMGVIVNPVP